ncbi:restriction endonuclease subunit S [Aeribacillus composti]|uniref:restriction endonuclease subunit S n=1 Tax=Aeribacillus composti TaxID=1868734 RepID=UPI00406A230B
MGVQLDLKGYQKTEIGVIPKDWCVKRLKDIAEINKESLKGNTDKEYKFYYYDLSSVNKGKLLKPTEKIQFKNAPSRARRVFKRNNILMSTVRPYLQGFAYIDFESDDCICSTGFAVISGERPSDIKYIYHNLFSYTITNQIQRLLVGSNYPAINTEDVENLKIPYPNNKNERAEIASILSTWDKAIELKEKLIEQKKQQKKGLMQKLLTGEVRLPGFNDKWIKVKFGKVLKFLKKEPVKNPQDYYLLTVKLHLKGVDATDKKPNVTTNGRPYYLREPNELLIGRQNFHNGGIGIVPEHMKNYVASNAISSVGAIKGNLRFYYYYLSNANFYKRIEHIIGGTGQKEISESMMKKLKLFIPQSEKEQTAIANVLGMVDKEIDLLEEELLQLKQQKKGLMQLLLTGKVRVKV